MSVGWAHLGESAIAPHARGVSIIVLHLFASFLELSEVFCGPYRTGFRRMGILAERDRPTPEDATLEQRWKIYIAHEERRRTGMACFREPSSRPSNVSMFR